MRPSLEIFFTFFRLGLTSFGGPIAHLGFFHHEFVKRKRWLSDNAYNDLVILCQFLPGPASSQVGMAIGLSRAGVWGAILAWIGFTLPSAVILLVFGLGLSYFKIDLNADWIHGFKIVAVSIVAQAIWSMGKKLCPDHRRKIIALLSAIIIILFSSVFTQIFVLILAGFVGASSYQKAPILPNEPLKFNLTKRIGTIFLLFFILLLVILPLLRLFYSSHILNSFDSYYRTGSLVFGGGHVVLPFLEAEVVDSGWVSKDVFMAGYGLAQAVPGPLFSFSAYLGAVSIFSPNGWIGGGICLIALFLPSFLLILGVLPHWEELKNQRYIRQAMMGVNASMVGILMAAFYNPVWVSAIFSVGDFVFAIFYFILLEFKKVPSWAIVLMSLFYSLIF